MENFDSFIKPIFDKNDIYKYYKNIFNNTMAGMIKHGNLRGLYLITENYNYNRNFGRSVLNEEMNNDY